MRKLCIAVALSATLLATPALARTTHDPGGDFTPNATASVDYGKNTVNIGQTAARDTKAAGDSSNYTNLTIGAGTSATLNVSNSIGGSQAGPIGLDSGSG